MLGAVSRAPLHKLQAYKRRMGWTFSWASSQGSGFNFDLCAAFTEEQQREGIECDFRREPMLQWRAGQEGGGEGAEAEFAAMCGADVARTIAIGRACRRLARRACRRQSGIHR